MLKPLIINRFLVSLFYIKLGKAWQVIRRDGAIHGLRRVCGAFFAMFRPVGDGDILFISGGVGDSALYRTMHVAEELQLHGFRTSVTVQDNPFLMRYVKRFSIFVFHRTLYTDRIRHMIEDIKAAEKTIIFETDDLVYDPQYLVHMDYYKKMNAWERKLYEHGVGGEILHDAYVHVATTTTAYLAEKLQQEGKRVFVVPNKLSVRDLHDIHKTIEKKAILKSCVTRADGKIRLGYFSGTISHNKDFGTITDALVQVMNRYKNVELLLVGPLDVDNVLVQKFGKRIRQLPYASRVKHFFNIAQCDINLAPLELNNPFCESKSELKFFEAGIVSVPTVAVANRTFSDAIEDGVDGFVARDTDEWVNKISRLIEDDDLRSDMGVRACEKVLKKYTTKNAENDVYYEYLRNEISQLRSR